MKLRFVVALAVLVLPPFSLHAAQIAILGSSATYGDLPEFLEANGHVVDVSGANNSYDAFDTVLLIGRTPDVTLVDWVRSGGRLITDLVGGNRAILAGLMNVETNSTWHGAVNARIALTDLGVAAGLASGMASPYVDGIRTQDVLNFTSIGAGVRVLGERAHDHPTFPQIRPAILSGPSGDGWTLLFATKWAQNFDEASADHRQLVLNAIEWNPNVIPEPASATLALWAIVPIAAGCWRKRGPRTDCKSYL